MLENHDGFRRTFQQDKLTLGLMLPIEAYAGNMAEVDVTEQIHRSKITEKAGFAALYARDIPLNDPFFGDAGQLFDPWLFLSYLSSHTTSIALGTASIITSFRHPLHIAKAAASLDLLSNNRLLLGLATGDRSIEFDSFRTSRNQRIDLYQDAFNVLRTVWKYKYPSLSTNLVSLTGETDIVPKPALKNIPMLVTGFSGQNIEWIAKHSDGWMSYPRVPDLQAKFITDYRTLAEKFKPFAQPLQLDLAINPDEKPAYTAFGFRSGSTFLKEYLFTLQQIGVNHVIINLKTAKRPVAEIIQELGETVLPDFMPHSVRSSPPN
ncbi:MAG TPA: LLM class oxidoreductase [Pseudogracilibacillus sp.]|nr:LLM class oxidoreductase [Pseudogracilibacillus sp.]